MDMVQYLTFSELWELPFSKVLTGMSNFSVVLGSWYSIRDNGVVYSNKR